MFSIKYVSLTLLSGVCSVTQEVQWAKNRKKHSVKELHNVKGS